MFSLRPRHFKRYKDFAVLLWKYGDRDTVGRADLTSLLPQDSDPRDKTAAAAHKFAIDIERMGPTFIKLGQLLSTRPDIVPPACAQALARLQDKCEPLPYADVARALREELGVEPEREFLIDQEPLATASMSQVHRARMRDGREIVLKVQRPGLREQVLKDLAALGDIAKFLHDRTDFGNRSALPCGRGGRRRACRRDSCERHQVARPPQSRLTQDGSAKLRKGLQASRCLVGYARAPCGSSSSTTTWTTRKASAIC